jgi:precorrin-6B methylase 2
MNSVEWKAAIKRRVLPDKAFYIRTPFGLAAGSVVHLNPRRELRCYFGLNESQLVPIYRRLLKPGMNVFDVGSSTGYNAVGFARFTGGKVVAFEATPALVAILHEVASRNDLQIAIEAGYVGDGKSPDSLSLDVAAHRHFLPDFIKIDIEGCEARALEGCGEILARGGTSLVVETHGEHVEEQCVEILQSYRYDVETIEPNRSEKKRRQLGHNRWLIAIPRST